MKSAASVVLRKDMSLNRRLYAWLLGPDDNPEQQIKYFHDYGKAAMVSAFKVRILISKYMQIDIN